MLEAEENALLAAAWDRGRDSREGRAAWRRLVERHLSAGTALSRPALDVLPGSAAARRQLVREAAACADGRGGVSTASFVVVQGVRDEAAVLAAIGAATARSLLEPPSTAAVGPALVGAGDLARLTPLGLRRLAAGGPGACPARTGAGPRDFMVAVVVRARPAAATESDYFDHLDEYDYVEATHGTRQPAATRSLDGWAAAMSELLGGGAADATWLPCDHASALDLVARMRFMAALAAERSRMPGACVHACASDGEAHAILSDGVRASAMLSTAAGWVLGPCAELLAPQAPGGGLVMHASRELLEMAARPRASTLH